MTRSLQKKKKLKRSQDDDEAMKERLKKMKMSSVRCFTIT